ncbi:MAG: response regulator [Desulfotignum sp.]|nr:response regulator [Desulfotignum sp.]MCF8112304.1 response regulator [Desulfotignum sp.]MCF8125210.1 response regulator [Desulfotignum sp.]
MEKILAIDDKMDNLVTLSALLKNLMPDCLVITARSGMEGLEKARKESPDVILLDVQMPGMDGFETCRNLMSDKTTCRIPVIMLTAIRNDPLSRIKGLEVGANTFLAKPIDPYELVSQVKVGLRIKKAEDALRREKHSVEAERERLISAIEQAGEMIIVTDTKGTIQYVNPAFERITGYCSHDVLGKNMRILKSGKQDPQFYENLWATISSGRVWKGHLENKRMDGTCYTEDATISPVFDTHGKIVNYVAVKRDITEQMELESQFLQAQKMESVGRLAGGVTHDFNNMLSVIIGNADLAMSKTTPDDPVYNHLKEIATAAGRSSDITRKLLAFARKQTISPKTLDLNKTVEGMLKMLKRLIGEDINLNWQPAENLWQVKMDPSQVDQILANLCVNARDAIAGVGKLTIETKMTSFDHDYCANHPGFVPGDFVLLAVRDTGCGMDRHTLDNIFEPFFTTKKKGKGTGLGLSTVYGIVKQNNGFIMVDSEINQGTCFNIYLPRLVGESETSAPENSGPVPEGKGETLLIVEDEPAILELASEMTKNLGYTVLEALTPNQAITLAQQHKGMIHLLFTDVIMPEMNGPDLAGLLTGLYPDIKCLFMSGYTADIIARQGVLDDEVHFIQKPFSRQTLAVKLRDVLDAAPVTGSA